MRGVCVFARRVSEELNSQSSDHFHTEPGLNTSRGNNLWTITKIKKKITRNGGGSWGGGICYEEIGRLVKIEYLLIKKLAIKCPNTLNI